MDIRKAGIGSTGALMALAMLGSPAFAQRAVRHPGSPGTAGTVKPIVTDLGMPLPAGMIHLSAAAGLSTGLSNTQFTLD
ncbi:MAG: hypothetical protein KGR26_10140, partial [Cyanobacteria bacterium REEB65]|nr:hypothetical protein [Cyanobacteria bacterium REEB65]